MRHVAYGKDPYGNTLVSVGGRELSTKVDISKMVEAIKAHGADARKTIELMIKGSLDKDFHLNLLQEEKDTILSELMTQIDEAAK